jgi:hypothetical protein
MIQITETAARKIRSLMASRASTREVCASASRPAGVQG